MVLEREPGQFNDFSQASRQAIIFAEQEARKLGHIFIGTEHILLGIMGSEDEAATLLIDHGATKEAVLRGIVSAIGSGDEVFSGNLFLVPRSKKVIELARAESLQDGSGEIKPKHLLRAIVLEGEGIAAGVLDSLIPDLHSLLGVTMSSERDQERAYEVYNRLNFHFEEHGFVYDEEILPLIRSLPRPIVVDFNGLFCNNQLPLTVNPEAGQVLGLLREIGNVVIVTTASDWGKVHGFLQDNGLWFDDMVLMTQQNYYNESAASVWDEIADYLHFIKTQNPSFVYRFSHFMTGSPSDKRIAPVFMKPFPVPILDDNPIAIFNNPGMKGIPVKSFVVDPEKEWEAVFVSEEGMSFLQAVEQVREFYRQPEGEA